MSLKEKIVGKSLRIGVIGLGYVGLPLAVEKAKAGFTTLGFDIQRSRVEQLNQGENYIGDVVDAELKSMVDSKKLTATTDFSLLSECDFIAICVPTPLDKYQQPDLSYVRASCEKIAQYLKKDTMVVLESTTYPGTTEEIVKPILENSGLVCGEDFYLGFSPERVDPGNKLFNTKNTPKVVGAIGDKALELISMVYECVLEGEVHRVSSPAVAEMEKILENTYRNINIGLINEIAILCDKMGINVWEVIEAAKSKPYGFQAFYPGPGLGGHCIPLDPYYLSYKAREYNFHTSMIEASMTINDNMPSYTVDRIARILNHDKKALNGSKVLTLGVAYKQDIDDFRESPALKVMDILRKAGSNIDYYDPWVPSCKFDGVVYHSIPDLNTLADYDIVVITTMHSNVDYALVCEQAKRVFDTKNATKYVANRGKVELL